MKRFAVIVLTVALLAPAPAYAQSDGGTDLPKVVHLKAGGYLLSELAWSRLDAEMRRLQTVEYNHKRESWQGIVGTSAMVGLLVGATLAILAREAVAQWLKAQ